MEPGTDATAAVTLSDAAAQAAARGAPAPAAALLRRALEEPLVDEVRATALMRLGEAERNLGRPEAVERFMQAARIAGTARERYAAAVAAGHAAALDPARGEAVLGLLDSVEMPDGERSLAVSATNARPAAAWGDASRFHAIASEAEALAPITGATTEERRLLAHLARARLDGGGTAVEVAALAERAIDPEDRDDAGSFVTLIVALTAADHYDAAERLALGAAERARERAALNDYHMALTWQARIALLRGDLAEAEGIARAALEAGAVLRDWWRLTPAAVLVEALIDQGRADEAGSAWAATELGEAVPPQRSLTPLIHARGRLRLARGDPAAALEDLRHVSHRLGAGAAATVRGLTTRLRTAEALHALGRDDAAQHESIAAVDIARRFGATTTLGATLRVHGKLTDDHDTLREAAECLHDAPARLELAQTLIELGATMRRRGARRDSREPLRTGHDLALACAARRLAEHARSELAASGVHVERGDFARRDQLTPSERRIAEMAAAGASNKQIAQSLFLTVKTVEMHLSNCYRKLDIRSRRDLPPALATSLGEPRTTALDPERAQAPNPTSLPAGTTAPNPPHCARKPTR
jgi:DNA-binding CsgD family transcriptional regulator/tetratricopeptide (TPR) repeat protein